METHFIERFKDDLFVDPTNSVLAKEAFDGATFSARLAAACVIEKEHSAWKHNLPGKTERPSSIVCQILNALLIIMLANMFRGQRLNLHMVLFSPFQSPSLC